MYLLNDDFQKNGLKAQVVLIPENGRMREYLGSNVAGLVDFDLLPGVYPWTSLELAKKFSIAAMAAMMPDWFNDTSALGNYRRRRVESDWSDEFASRFLSGIAPDAKGVQILPTQLQEFFASKSVLKPTVDG